jgi:putative addiction module killer protein
MKLKKYKIDKVSEYEFWLKNETEKSRVQILKRLSNIELEGHFGDHKYLESAIWELRWINGRRVYYAHITEFKIVLLLGGNKNGQSKDINKAKKLCYRYQK